MEKLDTDWQRAHGAGLDWLARLGALQSSETEFERTQVIACGVARLTILLYGAKQFPHGALKPIVEPATF